MAAGFPLAKFKAAATIAKLTSGIPQVQEADEKRSWWSTVQPSAGPPLDWSFKDLTLLAGLADVEPVSGIRKGCAPAALPSVAAAQPLQKPQNAAQAAVQRKRAPMQVAAQQRAPAPRMLNSRAIRLSSNPLTSLTGLEEAVAAVLDSPSELRWLDLSQCRLTDISEALTSFPKLQMLYLHANSISKLGEVRKLGVLKHLQKLTLHGNPVTEQPHYKLYVCAHIPSLQSLDFVRISKVDRECIAQYAAAHLTAAH